MIKKTIKGNFNNSMNFFNNSKSLGSKFRNIMKKYGEQGVNALMAATPTRTGLTASSWYFTIEKWGLSFSNSNLINGVPVAILIQLGHGTKGGGYVQGIDYINPALRPIFEEILSECEKEVKNL